MRKTCSNLLLSSKVRASCLRNNRIKFTASFAEPNGGRTASCGGWSFTFAARRGEKDCYRTAGAIMRCYLCGFVNRDLITAGNCKLIQPKKQEHKEHTHTTRSAEQSKGDGGEGRRREKKKTCWLRPDLSPSTATAGAAATAPPIKKGRGLLRWERAIAKKQPPPWSRIFYMLASTLADSHGGIIIRHTPSVAKSKNGFPISFLDTGTCSECAWDGGTKTAREACAMRRETKSSVGHKVRVFAFVSIPKL
ncbi:hypothetical protein GW17_00037567 [Ensete ventricosum]|nr:hypothetical protein GW17_00037567 [Ensete ventricosum]